MDFAQILHGFCANFAPANRISRIRPATADAAFGNFRAFAALLARFQISPNAVGRSREAVSERIFCSCGAFFRVLGFRRAAKAKPQR